MEAPRRAGPGRPHYRAGPSARREAAAATAGSSPSGRPAAPRGRRRRSTRRWSTGSRPPTGRAHPRVRAQRLHCRWTRASARTAPTRRATISPPSTPGSFVEDKVDHEIGGFAPSRATVPRRRLDRPDRGHPGTRRRQRRRPRLGPRGGCRRPGQMVAIMGTSTCHVMRCCTCREAHSRRRRHRHLDGAPRPASPGVGDIFVANQVPKAYEKAARLAGVGVHEHLTALAAEQPIGAHGLVALDWWSGNLLVDHDLSGLVVGLTLTTALWTGAARVDRVRGPGHRRDVRGIRGAGDRVHRDRRAAEERPADADDADVSACRSWSSPRRRARRRPPARRGRRALATCRPQPRPWSPPAGGSSPRTCHGPAVRGLTASCTTTSRAGVQQRRDAHPQGVGEAHA